MRIFIHVVAAAALGGATVSEAAPSAQRPALWAASEVRDGKPALSYYCFDECLTARFVCVSPFEVELSIGVPLDATTEWLTAADAVDARPFARINFAGEAQALLFRSLTYSEMGGEYFAQFEWRAGLSRDGLGLDTNWLSGFAVSNDVSVVATQFEIVLSPTEGDPEAREAFVDACLAM